jgi:hypothetical protein
MLPVLQVTPLILLLHSHILSSLKQCHHVEAMHNAHEMDVVQSHGINSPSLVRGYGTEPSTDLTST